MNRTSNPGGLSQLLPFLAILAILLQAILLPHSAWAASDQYKEITVQEVHKAPQQSGSQSEQAPGTSPSGKAHVAPLAKAASGSPLSPTAAPAQQKRGNGLGASALALGLLSFILVFIPVIGLSAVLFAIAAIVLGALGIGRDNRPGMAIAGMIFGIIVLILYILALVALSFLF